MQPTMPARAHLHQGLGDKTTLALLFTLQETLRGGLELASQLSGGQPLISTSVVSLFHASRAVGLCSQWLMEFYLDSSFPSSLAGPSPSMPCPWGHILGYHPWSKVYFLTSLSLRVDSL